MAGGVAFVNSDPNAILLNNFADQVVIRLGVGPGTYVVFGRVVLVNKDRDSQKFSARIASQDGTNLIDKVDTYLLGNDLQVVALQGTLIVKSPDIVAIRCSTYRGGAGQSSLFAVEVAQLKYQA